MSSLPTATDRPLLHPSTTTMVAVSTLASTATARSSRMSATNSSRRP
ncbi:hypothetical protein BN1723_021010 [Verticillium longisporum]|uniref:Uncharacterized protein n=1 Tax=Verticillium longisporum TaxID=100787 RepID=A0A0G4KTM9_VERLO|nr:hypothetical protein BN1723_021010 [Verticillium longisporum]